MKRLSILIILLLVSVGIGFAQEVETNTIDTENTIIPQEEIQQQDIADEPPPVQEEESPEEIPFDVIRLLVPIFLKHYSYK